MRLPDKLRQRLAEEFQASIESMRANPDPAKKLYFFSVFYGEATRILNLAWDADLALIQNVTQAACSTLLGRLSSIQSGDRNVELPGEFFPALEKAGEEIANYMASAKQPKEVLYGALARIAELTYFSTGNGYYLYLRGKIKL